MVGGTKAPKPSAEERALQASQAALLNQQRDIIQQQQNQQKILLPFLAEQEGYDIELDDNGNIKGIKKIANETDELNKTLEKELAQRSLKALRGELEVDPALEDALKTQKETLKERLARQFGPGYETSTAGVDALGEFDTNAETLRSNARTGQLTLSQQLGVVREQQNDASRGGAQDYLRQISTGDNMTFAGAYGQVASGYGQAQQSYQQQRQMQMQASMNNRNSMFQLIGAGVGAIGSVMGSPAAGAALFSDERLKSNAVRISTHKRLGIPIYKYTIGHEERIGVFASDVEARLPDAVGKRRGYKTVDYGRL